MRYRRKQPAVEAMQWNGDNATEIVNWAQGGWKGSTEFDERKGGFWIKQIVIDPDAEPIECVWRLVTPTDIGPQDARPGDWIVKINPHSFTVYAADNFRADYEPVAA